MIGTVIVTAVYSNTTKLGNAYGVCVIFVTFITTCMVSLVAIIIWKINILIVIFFFLTFAALDGVYLSVSDIRGEKASSSRLFMSICGSRCVLPRHRGVKIVKQIISLRMRHYLKSKIYSNEAITNSPII
jgi:K+ transporter